MASLREQVEYEHWATLESVKAIRAADKLLAEAEAIVAHVVGIRELWAARVEGVAARFEAWPKLALEQSAMEVAGLRRRWLGLCDAHAAEARIDYRSSGSEACVNTFGEVVQEVLLHGAHHRGQIALLLRRSGHERPRSTDFIPALRLGRF